MTINPPDYTTGLGETIRAYRSYMGLSRDAMSARLGMNQRSYERIESNQRACPPGLLDTVQQLADQFDREVELLTLTFTPLEITDKTDGWTRAVYGRVAVEAGRPLRSTT